MLTILRMVIVLSLVGYSANAASSVMHLNEVSQVATSVSFENHSHAEAGSLGSGGVDSVFSRAGDILDKTCCEESCVSIAIIEMPETLPNGKYSSSRFFLNDQELTGEVSPIHLPPNI